MVKGTSLTFDSRRFASSRPLPHQSDRASEPGHHRIVMIMTGIRVAPGHTPQQSTCLDLGTGFRCNPGEWRDGVRHMVVQMPHSFSPEPICAPTESASATNLLKPRRRNSGNRMPNSAISRMQPRAACIPEESIRPHDFPQSLHPFLSKQANMMIIEGK